MTKINEHQICKIYGTDFLSMTRKLLAYSDLAGRIPDKNCRIGIKPNLVCPTPADYGATTHPEIIAGIIEYLQEHGFSNLVILEGSWVGDKTEEAFEYCGYNAISGKYGVPLIDTQKQPSHKEDCGGMELNITDAVRDIDFLINVPVLKGHCQTKVTCALKNMKGLLPNSEKRRFHTMGLHKPIAHLSLAVRPDFIVVDHICGDPDFEEGGNPLVRNCIFTALDPVLTDSYACRILGYKAEDIPYIKIAEKLGTGTADLTAAEILELDEGDAAHRQIFPSDAFDEEDVPERRILDVSYAVDEVDSCSACYGSLIPALCRLREEGLLENLHEKIAIGQGHRGNHGRLGIGKCTKDFDFCVMGCPPDEETIYRELKKLLQKDRTDFTN